MRFAALHLRAYGPFTGKVLDFGSAPSALQIAFGPNEAGKSSALRAVHDFLYGIPGQTTDNFVHDYPDLRVGAVLIGEDGRRHAVIRRKGNKNVLFAFDEATGEEKTDRALPADYLLRLMPGVDEALFATLYGLSHEALRRGGEALVLGEGDVGRTLFAAGAGLADIKGALESFDEQARELFKQGGRNQVISASIGQYEEAIKAFRDAQVKPKAWKELDEALQAAVGEAARLHEESRAKQAEVMAKQRLRTLHPMAVSRQSLLASLQKLNRAVKLPTDTASVLSAARERIAVSKERVAAAIVRKESAQRTLQSIVVSEVHLQNADAIEALHHSAVRAREEREKVISQGALLGQKRAAVAAVMSDIAPQVPVEKADSVAVNSAIVARMRNLSRQLIHAGHSLATDDSKGHQAERDLETAHASLAVLAPPGDVSGLEATLESLQRQGDLERTLGTAKANLDKCAAQLARLCKAIEQPDEKKLLALVVPQKASVEGLKKSFDERQARLRRIAEKEGELQRDIALRRTEIGKLEAVGSVVTAESVAALRAARNKAWGAVRGAYVDKTLTEKVAAEAIGATRPIPEEYERLVLAADEQADFLRLDTARATKYAGDRLRIDEMTAELERLEKEKGEISLEDAEFTKKWLALLEGLRLSARSPDALLEWMREYDNTLASARERDAAQAELDEAHAALERARTTLAQAYRQAGLAMPELSALSALINHAKTQVALAGERSRDIEALKKQKATAEREAARARAACAAHEIRRNKLIEDAAADLKAIGLNGEAGPDEIDARLERLGELSAALLAVEQAQAAVAASDQSWRSFVGTAGVLSRTLDLETPKDSDGWFVIASSAYAQLKAAEKAQAQREALVQAIEKEDASIEEERAAAEAARGRINELVKLANCQDESALSAAIDDSERLRVAESDLEKLEAGLRAYPEKERAALLEAAASAQPETLDAEIDALQSERDRLEPLIKAAQEKAAEARAELNRIDGSATAVSARETMEHYAAIAQRESGKYVRIRLAHALLTTAIRTYQERSQGPLVRRASEWFARLTEGRYLRLVVDYDEDRQTLLAERHDKRLVKLRSLSEGAADQLYLALRLAAIEGRLDSTHGMPLILDDALLAFDNNRVVAALKALAELSARNQVILFTHHEHIVRLAESQLKKADFATHEIALAGPARELPA